jgi:hypothetical protein
MLVLATGAADAPAFMIQNDAKFQGAVYAGRRFPAAKAATMHGPVITSALDLTNDGLPAGPSP